ncbi:MAG: hypothetical protein J7L51_01425 [Desulfurococcales archaeon]|nr:hypothetical protein [Desulfurococcales archaeon]
MRWVISRDRLAESLEHALGRYGLRVRTLAAFLSLEALIANFYVVITRSITPILLVSVGFSIRDILMLNILAYLTALATAYYLNQHSDILKKNVKVRLLAVHSLERIFWGIIPLTALLAPALLYVNYIVAVTLTIPTSSLMSTVIFTRLSNSELRRLLTRRGALGAVSNVIGQVTAVMVLMSTAAISKYIYLYLLAMAVGLMSTLVIALTPIPARISGPPRTKPQEVEEVSVKLVNVFLFLASLLASGAILGVVWGPYLMKYLQAPDYLAASLGLVQTISVMGSSLFWGGRPYSTYKLAILANSLVPLLIIITPRPELHLAVAALYAFSYTGSNFLASLIYGEVSKSFDVGKTATMLAAASSLAQILGLGVALLISQNTSLMFIVAAILSIIATAIAFTTIPETALPRESYVRVYSRVLYNISVSSYNFTIFTLRSTALLAAKLLGFATVLLILYIIYRVLYYIVAIIYGE